MTKMVSTLFSNYIRIGMEVEGPSGLLSIGAALAPMFTAPECARVQQQAPQDPSLESLVGWLGGAARNALPRHRWPMYDNLLRKLLEQGTIDEFKAAWARLQRGSYDHSAIESYRREFEGLVDSERPIDVPDAGRGSRLIFRMEDSNSSGTFGSLSIKAESVDLLRTVTALTGYVRGAISDLAARVHPVVNDLSHPSGGDDWYAASEAFGEGVLLSFDRESAPVQRTRWREWNDLHVSVATDSGRQVPDQLVPWTLFRSAAPAVKLDADWRPTANEAGEFFAEVHPLFVWWHTFAHHLIRAVQAETGYSSASIAERIYAVPKPDGTWRGAALIYVTEGGMDGTLGGLTALLPNFQTFLNRLTEDGLVCSNDPLCEETPRGLVPQVACYACTLNPETSCEHRNMFLDRLLLFEGAGF